MLALREQPRRRLCVATGTIFLLTVLAGHSLAQAPAKSTLPGGDNRPTRQPSRLGPTDTSFLMRAAEGGLYEVAAGKLAASRGHLEQVRAFGVMLVADHSAISTRLTALARDHGVTVPGEIPAKQEVILERLLKLSGTEFDRQFIQTVGIDNHQEAIALFQKAAASVQSEAVRAFAQESLPTLQAHLAAAEQLARMTAKVAETP